MSDLQDTQLKRCKSNKSEKDPNILMYAIFSQTRGLLNFYSMSYLYFGAMATSSVIIVGLIVSYATGKQIKRLQTH